MPRCDPNVRPEQRKTSFCKSPRAPSPRSRWWGPSTFGIVAIDCPKARSRLHPRNFYCRTILEPATSSTMRGDLQAAIDRIRWHARAHDLKEVVVAIERTGEYIVCPATPSAPPRLNPAGWPSTHLQAVPPAGRSRQQDR